MTPSVPSWSYSYLIEWYSSEHRAIFTFPLSSHKFLRGMLNFIPIEVSLWFNCKFDSLHKYNLSCISITIALRGNSFQWSSIGVERFMLSPWSHRETRFHFAWLKSSAPIFLLSSSMTKGTLDTLVLFAHLIELWDYRMRRKQARTRELCLFFLKMTFGKRTISWITVKILCFFNTVKNVGNTSPSP